MKEAQDFWPGKETVEDRAEPQNQTKSRFQNILQRGAASFVQNTRWGRRGGNAKFPHRSLGKGTLNQGLGKDKFF